VGLLALDEAGLERGLQPGPPDHVTRLVRWSEPLQLLGGRLTGAADDVDGEVVGEQGPCPVLAAAEHPRDTAQLPARVAGDLG
jgi:hypothetical protein